MFTRTSGVPSACWSTLVCVADSLDEWHSELDQFHEDCASHLFPLGQSAACDNASTWSDCTA